MTARDSVTIRDVARQAGVSPGTVSRAINNSPLVNDETRQRIMDVVEELNYRPNIAARRLSLGKTLTIAVIVPFFTRPSVTERLRGVVSSLSETEYDLMIHNVETPEQRAHSFRTIPYRESADGVLIISLSPTDEEAEMLSKTSIPVVLIDADHPDLTRLHRVTVDDVAGGRVATEYLLALGHRRIGFIGDNTGDAICDEETNPLRFTSSFERHQGYEEALRRAGVSPRPDYYGTDRHGRHQAARVAHQMLRLAEPPTAILAASDTQAVGVLEAARDLKVSIPEELSVVGYDDVEIADILGLTTMRQPLFQSGERGVELLLGKLNQGPEMAPVSESLPTELIVRNTTAPPPDL